MATVRGILSLSKAISLINRNHAVYAYSRKKQVVVDGWKLYAASIRTIKAIKLYQSIPSVSK